MTIHLAIAFDQNYLQPFYALFSSIVRHHPDDIHLHIIATGVEQKLLDRITSYGSDRNVAITFYKVDDPRLEDFVTRGTWTKAVYYRLYFPLLIDSSIQRIIYLDTDTLVVDRLDQLYHHPLAPYPIGAVHDNYVKVQPLIEINTPGDYFNSGMLLIDTEEWRTQKISERAIDYLIQFPERIKYVDQCALNAILVNNWMKLDVGFNLLSTFLPQDATYSEILKTLKKATVIHFTLERPWEMLCKNRLRSFYKQSLQSSTLYNGKTIVDFSFRKIPAWLRIRLVEYYADRNWLKDTWRFIKSRRQ
jgi:lipopolysaccharide biosynthesis glycosyltransferase